MPTVNIATHLKEMARQRPEQLAVLFPAGRDSAGRSAYTSYTYERLDAMSDLLAEGLRHIGVGRGVRTVLMVPPSLEFFALTFALFKAGAVPVFVDPGMGLKNIGQCLTEAQPEAFVGIAKAHLARRLFGWGRKTLRRLVAIGRGAKLCRWLGNDVTCWDGSAMSFWDNEPIDSRSATERAVLRKIHDALQQGKDSLDLVDAVIDAESNDDAKESAEFAIADTSSEETAAILFTSGSTGVPKGAIYSHGNFVAQVEMLRRTFSIEPGEVDLCTFPLFALFASALGMTAIVPRMDFTRPAKVNPLEVSGPINAFHVANLFGSPALLNRVGRHFSGDAILAAALDDEERTQAEKLLAEPLFPSLRRVLSAGAPVSPAILERFSRLIPPDARIFTPYGATESLPVAVIDSREVLDETRQKTATGAGTCVGLPVEGVQVSIIRITDEPIPVWDDSLLLPRGEIGEIVVRGPQVTQAYFNRPDLTALAKIRDPDSGQMRHRMGDVGYFDEKGRLWFCGRKSQRVISSARTFFTETVEGVFNAHPSVFRTALVGVARHGQIEPVLCVEREIVPLNTGSRHRVQSNETVKSELLELGARFEHTRPIRTILFHDAFPVDVRHNSKIFREKLAIWAARQLK